MTKEEHQHIFESWLAQHKGLIFKVIRAYASTAMDMDDLFQEITIQIWHSVPKFRQASSAGTWLYRIALYTAIKWMTRERKHHHAEMPENLVYLLTENKVPVDERLDWLYKEIHALDEIDRSITLLMLDNFSYREMADILGISESNVGVKINRVKKHLISKSKKYDQYGIQ